MTVCTQFHSNPSNEIIQSVAKWWTDKETDTTISRAFIGHHWWWMEKNNSDTSSPYHSKFHPPSVLITTVTLCDPQMYRYYFDGRKKIKRKMDRWCKKMEDEKWRERKKSVITGDTVICSVNSYYDLEYYVHKETRNMVDFQKKSCFVFRLEGN